MVDVMRQRYCALYSFDGELLKEIAEIYEDSGIRNHDQLPLFYHMLANQIQTMFILTRDAIVNSDDKTTLEKLEGSANSLTNEFDDIEELQSGPTSITAPVCRRVGHILWSCHVDECES